MKQRFTVQQLTLTALFTAILAALSQLAIPLPSGVPVTLQTFAVALCGFALGKKMGTASVVVYLLLGAVGLPVFSHFMGGIGVFFGVTGGFLWGFIVMAFLCGTQNVVLGMLGMLVMHLIGSIQFAFVAGVSFPQALVIATLPYLIKDALSIVAALFAAKAVRRGLAAARMTV